jgi:hypothetical protein
LVRKFLYVIAAVITIVIAAGFALRIYQDELTELAFVPTAKFTEQKALEKNIYEDPAMWFSGPLRLADDPTKWRPSGVKDEAITGKASVFFVHPTSFISRSEWNAVLDDGDTNLRTRIFLRGLSSPFSNAGQIWAPRYRQATIGAFLTAKPEGQDALNSAYRDVLLSFEHFLKSIPKDSPIVLVGHSQGARHLTYLMKDRVAGKALANRITAAYLIGWPISKQHDLPLLGLPLCAAAEQKNCIMTWASFAEPADYSQVIKAYDASLGLDGLKRKGSDIACTNPLNGGSADTAPATDNFGTLKPNGDMTGGELIAKSVPARCDENGFLLIGNPPKIGPYVLPGNNYHVYDIPLFWENTRRDVMQRLTGPTKK